jgi:phospholipid/cholesterol/gamma-HCH transport system substrate-binding protein
VASERLPQTLDQINAATKKLADAADHVATLADAMKAPADQLNTTTLPELQESLRNLNDASESVKDLVDSVQASPQGLINKPVAKERKVSQ